MRRVCRFVEDPDHPGHLIAVHEDVVDPTRDTLARVAEVTRILSEAAEPEVVLNAVLAAMGGKGRRSVEIRKCDC